MLLLVMAIGCIFVPIFSSYTYDGQNMANTFAGPSMDHIFGTDRFGRDVLVRIMYGGRISLAVGFSAAIISLCVGVTYGAIAGYAGGKVDMIMMRIVDALYSIPDMLYLIMIYSCIGFKFPVDHNWDLYFLMDGDGSTSTGSSNDFKRTRILISSLCFRSQQKRILLKHLIINSMGPIIVSFTMLVPSAIFYEATLGFLGIGLSAPQASWGTLANDARAMISSQPLQVVWPILAICLTMLALNFIGDGLGDALDPKKK